MATLLGGGVGGEQAHKKAQSYETRGHELYQLEDFKGAVQSFKDASNWYMKLIQRNQIKSKHIPFSGDIWGRDK